jgi:hypothetical protein
MSPSVRSHLDKSEASNGHNASSEIGPLSPARNHQQVVYQTLNAHT